MRSPLFTVVGVLWLATAVSAEAHEGHDHGAPPPPVTTTIAPRAEASSNDFEVVAIARGTQMVIHLDTFRTNEPIPGATIEIETPSGPMVAVATGEGVYAIDVPFIATPGRHDLTITVTAKDLVDILATTLVIPRPEGSDAPSTAKGWGAWLAAPAIAQELRFTVAGAGVPVWFAFVAGFAGGIGLIAVFKMLRRGSAGAAVFLMMAGAMAWPLAPAMGSEVATAPRDQAQRFPDGALFVPKATQHILSIRTVMTAERTHHRTLELPGRIIPDPNASGLVQSSVGGRLGPPPGGFKSLGTRVAAGDVLAYVTPPLPLADATSQQQQSRELDQQISIAARRLERLKSIEQVIARGQIEDIELELEGLRLRRANLERAPLQPEPLVAPVAGIIAASNAVAGQMAEPNSVIFQIVDPASLWVEALSYEAQPIGPSARAQVGEGKTADLSYVGSGFADRNQAVPIHFSITGDTKGLRSGQFVTVLATTSEERRGIAIPREAVVRSANGQDLVYEHTNAERFVAREVRIEPLDGTNVLIVAGVGTGRRIVTQGAELLNQIR